MTRWIIAMLTPLLLSVSGCNILKTNGESHTGAPESLYDSRLYNTQSRQPVSVAQLASELQPADVVIIGEYHGHQGSHLLQSQLQIALHRLRPAQVLSMEQFNSDHQTALDRYLEGGSGEAEMREDAQAWPNYAGSYRPLIEYAKRHHLPVIASNAPAQIVRCIGRLGPDYLRSLPEANRRALPEKPFYGTAAYRDKFFNLMGQHSHGDTHDLDETQNQRLQNSYFAQLLRDNTMADRIIKAMEAHSGAQVLHTTGTFHSEEHLGTVAALRVLQPRIHIRVISPIQVNPGEPIMLSADNLNKGDYIYFIAALPEDYADDERRRKARQHQFATATQQSCE